MVQTMRVVIAEDDPTQSAHLQRMVEEVEPNWDIAPIAEDWPTMLEAVEEFVPHILMLDIHMPGGSRDKVLEQLGSLSYKPAVIVITGDATLALEAFDAEVADYLVKPFRIERLAQAMATAQRSAAKNVQLASSTSPIGQKGRWLMATRGADAVIVTLKDVIFLQADRRHTRLVTREFEAVVRLGIAEVEKLLDEQYFIQVHRSTIVNIQHVDLVRRDEMGRLRVHLSNRPEKLVVSRPYEGQFKSL